MDGKYSTTKINNESVTKTCVKNLHESGPEGVYQGTERESTAPRAGEVDDVNVSVLVRVEHLLTPPQDSVAVRVI